MSSLGNRLRSARERKKLKQTEVKEKTGIHNKTLSGYENGVSEPDAETMRILANLYEVSTDYLLGNDPTTKRIISEEKMSEGMEIYNSLPDEEKKFVDDMIKKLYEKRR